MDKDSLYIFEAIQYILKAKKNIIIDTEQFTKTSEKIKKLYNPYQKKSYVVQAAGLFLPILIITSFTPNDGKIWAIYFISVARHLKLQWMSLEIAAENMVIPGLKHHLKAG